MGVSVCLCVDCTCECSVHRDQQKLSDLPEAGVTGSCNCLTWILGIELRTSAKAVYTQHWAIFPVMVLLFFKKIYEYLICICWPKNTALYSRGKYKWIWSTDLGNSICHVPMWWQFHEVFIVKEEEKLQINSKNALMAVRLHRGKDTCCQDWWYDFNPGNPTPHCKRKELTLVRCPLTSLCSLTCFLISFPKINYK